MKIKADMHIHPDINNKTKRFNTKQLINKAEKEKYGIISITCKDKVYYSKKLKEYAEKKGILLIKGIEKHIEGYHVLIYGLTEQDNKQIKNFNDLIKLKKRKNILVVAPHPFYPSILGHKCLKNKIYEYPDLFDAIEIQQLYTKIYNPNKKAILAAKKLKKNLVANSDAYYLSSFGEHHTIIELPRKFKEKDVFNAIKNNKTEIKTKPMSIYEAFKFLFKHL